MLSTEAANSFSVLSKGRTMNLSRTSASKRPHNLSPKRVNLKRERERSRQASEMTPEERAIDWGENPKVKNKRRLGYIESVSGKEKDWLQSLISKEKKDWQLPDRKTEQRRDWALFRVKDWPQRLQNRETRLLRDKIDSVWEMPPNSLYCTVTNITSYYKLTCVGFAETRPTNV